MYDFMSQYFDSTEYRKIMRLLRRKTLVTKADWENSLALLFELTLTSTKTQTLN